MKTIKELEAERQNAEECDEGDYSQIIMMMTHKIDTLKDVLGLIDELIYTDEYDCEAIRPEELKARIEG